MPRRVVVTALNMITPLGLDAESSWEGLAAGRSGIRPIALFDASAYASRIAGEVGEFDAYARRYCNRRVANQTARGTKLGYVCAKEAIVRSGIDFRRFRRSGGAVLFGAADTGYSAIHDGKYWILKTMLHGVSAWLAMDYGLEGPNFAISAACASSAYAVAYGFDLIAANRADVAVAGGASSLVTPEYIGGFNELGRCRRATSSRSGPSRPFSIDRDGFVIGEGAGVLLLEAEETAVARGAAVLLKCLVTR